VFKASRGFHYWQPATRWRPLPWLANPGNPAMSPHTEGRKQAPATLIKEWKEKGGTGEGEQPLSRVPVLDTQMLKENADGVKLLKCLVAQEHVES